MNPIPLGDEAKRNNNSFGGQCMFVCSTEAPKLKKNFNEVSVNRSVMLARVT